MIRLRIVACVLLLCVVGPAARGGSTQPTQPERPVGPLSPQAAITSFELEPGLAVQLVAGEPLVASPCAVAWDERGRMFVAENRGYPLGGQGGKPVGGVALLEDTDGDGLPDKRSEFATGLSFPNGLLPWRGGVIVADAPDILFLKDADGDGRAEVRELLLTGFSTAKTTQLRVNAPTLGPDGWIYLAGGLVGGKVHSPKRPGHMLDLARTDVRFRPDTGEMEPVEGKGQFGLTFDDAGHRFVCYNRVQVQHAPMPPRYLARNKHVASPGVLQNCPELVRNPLLGAGNDAAARIFPISSNLTTADSHAGTYSAACAVHIARGDALPTEYVGRAWSCDPTGNLVRYDALEAVGGSFHARRVRDNVEAFRSRDDWFRPVFLADGPDGALYVCDMYRRTIEHPEYLPEEVRKHTDFESGKEMGRIWRIARSDLQPSALAVARVEHLKLVSGSDTGNLIAALRSNDGWTRDTADRLITERGAAPIKAQLEAQASTPDGPPATVVACLNLLANADALSDAILLTTLHHPDAAVRENAARLSERQLANSPALVERVLALTGDEHVHVRYAAVLAAGEVCRGDGKEPSPDAVDRVVDALARTAANGRDAGDKWFRAAICTSLPTHGGASRLLEKLATNSGAADEGALALLHDLGRLVAVEVSPADLPGAFDKLWTVSAARDFDARAAVLVGFVEQGGAAAAGELRSRVAEDPQGELARAAQEAGRVAADAAAPVARRVGAVNLLALTGAPQGEVVLLSLVAPEQPVALSIAAVRGLVRPGGGTTAASKLLERDRWSRYSPALRSTVLTLLSGRQEFAPAMVGALESGAVPVATLSEPQRTWLRKAQAPDVRARATKLLAGGASEDRQRAFEDAKGALELTPTAASGQRMFVKLCATCHRLDREGYAVGPDLYGIRNQPKESILMHIVMPEREVAPNFAAYECITTDGRAIVGIMTADTPSSVTLRQALGMEETVPREKIKRLTASVFSLMPPGLEKAMTPQELADLLAYLRGEK